jgi:cytochrome P450
MTIIQTPQETRLNAQPPLATGLPFVGSMFGLANDSQAFLYDQYLKLGSVYRVQVLGNEFKVLAGPELNIMMATQPENFTAWDTWEPLVKDFGGRKTLTMLDGPEHSRLRKLMRSSFARSALMGSVQPVIDIVENTLKQTPMNTPIPVVRFIQKLTADELGLLSNERTPGDHFDDIVFWWNSLIEVYISRLKPVKTLQKPKYIEARNRVKEFARAIVKERQSSRTDSDEDNFIDNLFQANADDPDFMSEDEALFLTLAAYFAGLDTVANISSFMVYELLTHPDILKRAQAEADTFFANGTPNDEAFKQLDVIHYAAMETLRLYPIAGTLPRHAAQDFTFAGYPIRKGEFFMAATCATHFSPDYFKNPHEFDIERYAPPRNEHKVRGVYAPFGAGPHTCLGAGLAEVQIALTMATILHNVEFSLASPSYRLKRAYTPSLSPKGLEIKITGWRKH